MLRWKKNLKIDGARIVWKKPNKKSCFCQKFLHTNVGGNTNVQYVERHLGYKADDHLQKVFTEFLRLQILNLNGFRKISTKHLTGGRRLFSFNRGFFNSEFSVIWNYR